MFPRIVALVCIASVVGVGCTPRIHVIKNPCDETSGIRYYRPKPYLLITPGGKTTTTKKEKEEVTVAEPSDEFVTLSLQYLPDFSEEYAIDVRPGLGIADVNIKLDNGWNLTEVTQKLDSQADELITAASELAGAIPTSLPEDRVQPANYRWVVKATNIPLGYYESVITSDACRKKALCGWRYVGFVPYSNCMSSASSCAGPGNQTIDELYGLVFEEGAMVFKPLLETTIRDTSRVPVATGVTTTSKPGDALTQEENLQLSAKFTEAISQAQEVRAIQGQVSVTIDTNQKRIEIRILTTQQSASLRSQAKIAAEDIADRLQTETPKLAGYSNNVSVGDLRQ